MKKRLIFLSLFFIFLFTENAIIFAAGSREGYNTELTADIIKDNWKTGTKDDREGIYIQYNGSNPYLLAIIKNDGGYIGIYLSGPGGSGWQEGDVKAIFEQSDYGGREFNVTWFSQSGTDDERVRVVFSYDYSLFELKIPGFFGRTDYYAKIFPFAPHFARHRGSIGTGFLFNRDGYVITNFHVIENANHVLVRGIGGDFRRAYPYAVVLTDTENDIAVLKPEVSFLRFSDPPYNFRTNEAPTGSSIFALGYPMRSTMGDEIKLTDGIISAQSGFEGNRNAYQTTASISGGNSGGPLFDMDGYVIGINSAQHAIANNVYYAVKMKHVIELINYSYLRINIPPNRNSRFSGRNLAEITREVKDFVYMIEVF